MASVWSEEEVMKLIELWGEDSVQAQLEGSKRNSQIFDKIASEMRTAGYDRTGTQAREKIKKLRGEYRKIKDKKGKSGEGNKPWKYFDVLDAILEHKPATCPPVVVDTSLAVSDGEDEGKESEPTTIEDSCPTDNSQLNHSKSPGSHPSTPVPPPSKKHKVSQTDKAAAAMQGVVDQLLDYQKEAEAKFEKIEERRVQLEEKMAETERQRMQQEFYLVKQMFSFVTGNTNQGPSTSHFMYPTVHPPPVHSPPVHPPPTRPPPVHPLPAHPSHPSDPQSDMYTFHEDYQQ